ncbi:S9 family peptidase [Pseudogemmatithrix spongiicola]|uniref:S9 family peptidase n=1 Tax=Pseudogemmatithrix spongiicola TaxID=3062599 RepID=A0AA49JTY7_9BACT|nr:S9 family peptidase [Gemmatimonadaceae bacterium 'strain 138']WKW14859.1 S9 family peptidase [Gemmatimonadaceae bacterium 'strain 318']
MELTLHGERRVDDYAYFRDREHPETIPYLERENAYTDAMTAHTKPLEDALYAEIVARIKEDDDSVPVKDGGWFYQSRTFKGKQYPVHLRRRGSLDAPEETVLDENAEAEGLAYYELGGMAVSPDGNWLAVLEDSTGYEDFTLRIRDLRTGAWLADRIEKVSWGLAWANDNRTLFYVTFDAAKRGDSVWRHVVGTPREQDVRVLHEPDVTFNASVARARSGEWIVLGSSSFTSSEWSVLSADDPSTPPRMVAPRQPDLEYDVIPGDGWFYILTNREARNFQVMRAPFGAPGAWEPWLTPRADAFVEDVMAFKRHVVVTERREGLRRLVVHALATGAAHDVEFPESAYGVFPTSNPEFDTDTLRFMYSSPVTPNSVFDYRMDSRSRELKKRDEVLGGYEPSRYAVERTMATARDGTRIPVSMVYRKDLVRDGSRPLLLYAYGSYGYTLEPTFSSARVSLIDRGVIYAIAHIRGGQEMGRQWYDDGKMLKKMNTFTDFIDVAEHLVRERYTAPDRIVAHGGSAGGLLMGVVANLRPDLFRAIVADVPFVDVINTMLDASIPLTAQEWLQWGNPQVEAEYRYIRQYSPYDNVQAQAYPAMLVISGLYDPRVAYWEPTKWVAKLRALKTDTNVLLLRMQMTAGHGGGSGRYEQYREAAFRYAFMLDQLGLTT